MLTGYIVAESNDGGTRRVAVGDGIVMGRAADCDCVVDDAAASRRHVEIKLKGDEYRWRDLGSTNGTILNGTPMLEGLLTPDDTVQIGESKFRFVMEDEPPDTRKNEVKRDESTLFRHTIVNAEGAFEKLQVEEGHFQQVLQALYAVINAISAEQSSSRLLDRIVEETATALKAQRCTVLFADSQSLRLQPCPGHNYVHLYEDGTVRHVSLREIRVSKTVVERVLKDGESVLYQDTSKDAELAAAQSIVSLDLRSIICVPLKGREKILGLLYLDSNQAGQQYTEDDLLLSAAIGNSAGIALDNALLQQQLLEQQRTEQELELAWRIQKGFLVDEWEEDDNRFQVFGETRPAKTVGGDFYDFVQPAPHLAGILVGDVSGKGAPAALAMAKLLAEFRVSSRGDAGPAEVLAELNSSFLRDSQRGMFCTMAYALIDLNTGVMRFANAGHHPASILNSEGVTEFGKATGPPIGIFEEQPWRDESLILSPGDLVLIYSDGIAEARPGDTSAITVGVGSKNEGGGAPSIQDYGTAFFETFLMIHRTDTPRKLILELNEDVLRYCGDTPPHDDCTLIGLRYKP